jgi:hypothetical protein
MFFDLKIKIARGRDRGCNVIRALARATASTIKQTMPGTVPVPADVCVGRPFSMAIYGGIT